MPQRKMWLPGLVPTFLVVIALLLSACGSSTPSGNTGNSGSGMAPDDKQVFRWPQAANSDFVSLDPGLIQYTDGNYIARTIFSSLVALNSKGEVADQLAASHQISDDGLTYTFTLRDNLKFSDGTPVTAQDIVYSINRTLDPATKSQVAFYFELIKGYDEIQAGKVKTLIGSSLLAPDPKTVKIVIKQRAGYFLAALTYTASSVVNQKLIAKYGTRWTDHLEEGGTIGPFKVQSYSHTTGLTAIPDPNYFGAKPKLKKIQFLLSGDLDTTYKGYQAGQYDYTPIPPVNLDAARSNKGFRTVPELNTWYLALNYLTPPFNNIKVRQAFALAINKELLNKSVNRGAHKPTNNIIPPNFPAYNPNIKGVDGTNSVSGNPDKAKQLFQEGLKELGYKSAADLPPLTFTNRNQKLTQDTASAVIQQWQDVLGVKMQQNVLELAKFNDTIQAAQNNPKGAQIWFAGWSADYSDPQDWLSVFFAKGVSNNRSNYGQNNGSDAAQQQAVQQELQQADASSNQEERFKIYQDAEQKIVNDVGWIPLYHRNINRLINPKVKNYELNGYDDLTAEQWANVYISQ
jgi:oligopeptide transport system substrate-binding protein